MIKATKIGNTIVCFIKEKMYQKTFESDEQIISVYELMMNTNEKNKEEVSKLVELMSPIKTEGEIELEEEFAEKQLEAEKNAQLITWMETLSNSTVNNSDFEVKNSELFMKNIPIPIPEFLGRKFADPNLSDEERFSLTNFWRLLVLNPNAKCREDLYGFLAKNKMTITPSGCFIAYRNVNLHQEGNKAQNEFVAKEWATIISFNKNPQDYNLYAKRDKKGNITKYYSVETAKHFVNSTGSDYKEITVQVPISADGTTVDMKVNSYGQLDNDQDPHKGEVCIGNLSDLYSKLTVNDSNATIYTDGHSGQMRINIGEAVSIPRSQCDSNPEATCSRGLHAANSDWLEEGYFGNTGLAILINPMNVVACPYRDSGKLRCCEYMPVTVIDFDDDGKVIPFDCLSLDINYGKHTQAQLSDMISNAKFDYNKSQKIIPLDIDINQYKSMLFDYDKSLDVMTTIINNRVTDV